MGNDIEIKEFNVFFRKKALKMLNINVSDFEKIKELQRKLQEESQRISVKKVSF